MRRVLLNLLGWAVALAFLLGFWQRLGAQTDWQRLFEQVQWPYFWLAVGVLLIGHIGRTQLGYISTHYLQYPLAHGQVFRFWSLSQLAKYIPGGVWMVAAKVVLYARHGLPLLVASAATLWELLAVLGVGLLLGLFSVGVLHDTGWSIWLSAGALVLMAGMLLSLTPWPWLALKRLGIRGGAHMLSIIEKLDRRRFELLGRLSLLSLLIWLVTGTGFYILLAALNLAGQVSWWAAVVSYAVAWTAGFLVFVTPGGLGPREAMLTLILTPVLGAEMAFSVALLARLWWALAEIACILTALLWYAVLAETWIVRKPVI